MVFQSRRNQVITNPKSNKNRNRFNSTVIKISNICKTIRKEIKYENLLFTFEKFPFLLGSRKENIMSMEIQ